MVDYSNPENVKALADRVPAIDKVWSSDLLTGTVDES